LYGDVTVSKKYSINKNNFKFGPKLYLSSKNPIKKNKEKKRKKITKLK
jgi:rRNA processing protein Gar1